MIEKLSVATSCNEKRAIVVLDAGIATEENLAIIREKGYDYVCASRSHLTKYEYVPGRQPVCVTDNRKRLIELREVSHKSDEASDAHIHLALLAYWLVNMVRFQLKKEEMHSNWREIIRIMNTQKCVTTTMVNNKGELLWLRRCSESSEKVRLIYEALHLKQAPFIKKKSVVLKTERKKIGKTSLHIDTG